MIKVLQLVAAAVCGPGGERGVNGPELRALNALPHFEMDKVGIVVCYPRDGRLWREFTARVGTVVNFHVNSKYQLGAAGAIARIIRDHKVNVVHTQGPPSLDLFASIAARMTRSGMIVTRPVMIEDLKLSRAMRFCYRQIDRLTVRLADRVIAVSEAGYRHLVDSGHVAAEKAVLIRNGVELGRFGRSREARARFGIPQGAFAIGACAQLVHYKGWHQFLATIARLRERNPAIHGVVIGDGPLRQELVAEALRLGVSEAVTFTGHLPDVSQALGCLDLFMLLSDVEGLSVANIEALATGLPCVVTDVGGARELVRDGWNGYVVPRASPEHSMAAALRIIGDTGLREQMGRNSRQLAEEQFDIRRMVQQYQDLYLHVYGASHTGCGSGASADAV